MFAGMGMSESVFFWIMVGSMMFFAVSMIFGFDGSGDADVAGAGHVFSGGDGAASDGGHAVSWNVFSLRNLFLFGSGFGAVGFLAMINGYGVKTAASGGLAAGVLIAGVGMWFFRLIASQESNTVTDLARLVGRRANVVSAIPVDGMGEIVTVNEYGTRVSV